MTFESEGGWDRYYIHVMLSQLHRTRSNSFLISNMFQKLNQPNFGKQTFFFNTKLTLQFAGLPFHPCFLIVFTGGLQIGAHKASISYLSDIHNIDQI